MRTNDIPFRSRARCQVSLIVLKGHPNRFYHYSKTAGEEYSWAVRDYLNGDIVRSGDSTLTASEVEELVQHAELPPACPVGRIKVWQDECRAASCRYFGEDRTDFSTENPSQLGEWRGFGGGKRIVL